MATLHAIRPGESLSSIARKYDLPGWHTLYFAECNAAFRAQNPDPDVILPGRQIRIPPSKAEVMHVLRTHLRHLHHARSEAENMFERQEKEIRARTREIVGYGNKIDLTATLATLAAGIAKMTVQAGNILKMEGDELGAVPNSMTKSWIISIA